MVKKRVFFFFNRDTLIIMSEEKRFRFEIKNFKLFTTVYIESGKSRNIGQKILANNGNDSLKFKTICLRIFS